jgi:hypothetical protein
MYTRKGDDLVEIPADHEKVLAQYRDSMPVVFEVQECGPPMLYPLIDVDEEPYGTPRPGALEYAARQVAGALKAKRLGNDPGAPDFERLALAAIRAYVQDMADFAAAVAYGDGPAAEHQAAKTEATRAGRKLTKAVDRAVRDAQAVEAVAA